MFHRLMRRGRAPIAFRRSDRPIPVSSFRFAYHFEQAWVGEFLQRHAQGIDRIDAVLRGVDHHPETGDIMALDLDDGSRHGTDFVVD
ncbi:MAG: tryptophan 7-halogenase [Paracoccaceae bacterium]|nr:tryptophan 7-halogenase [Paracoccaceae bacterium]